MSENHDGRPGSPGQISAEAEQLLRGDALWWDAEPSDGCVADLDRLVDGLHTGRGARRWAVAAAAVVALGFGVLGTLRPWSVRDDGQVVERLWLDQALEPLERELAAVGDDAQALVDVVWQGMPLRSWDLLRR